MINLKDLQGAELLPKQNDSIPGIHCICCAQDYNECGCGADWSDYTTHNQAVSHLDKLGVEIDREELAKEIWIGFNGEDSPLHYMSELQVSELWNKSKSKDSILKFTDYIISSQKQWMRICEVK